MSIKSFLGWLRPVMSKPGYLQNMTPEERAERRRQDANRNMFAIQMFDMPKPRPYKAPWPRGDDGKPSSDPQAPDPRK
jgi:hypothetical protein